MRLNNIWGRTALLGRAIPLTCMFVAASLLAGCIAPSEPPRAGTVSTRSSAAHSASAFGVSDQSIVARGALVQVCADSGGCKLQPVDTETGLAIESASALETGAYPLHALSPNGRLLATITYPSSFTLTRGQLLLTDLESWTTVTTSVPISYVYSQPVFSPDGSKLAMVQELVTPANSRHLKVVEIVGSPSATTGASMLGASDGGRSELLPLAPIALAFSQDGTAINLYGNDAEKVGMPYDPQTLIARYDAETLQEQWQSTLPEVLDGQYLTTDEKEKVTPSYWDPHVGTWWQPARVFSHSGDTLYLVHANEDRMTTVDFANQEIATTEIAPAMSWLERLLMLTARPAYAKILNGTQLEGTLSLDGRQLYITGMERDYTNDTYNEEYLPLRIISTESGQLLATGAKGTIAQPTDVELRLYLNVYDYDPQHPTSSEWTVIANPGTGESIQEIEDWRIFPARRLDGAAIVVGSKSNGRSVMAIFDPDDFTPTPLGIDFDRRWGSWVLQ